MTLDSELKKINGLIASKHIRLRIEIRGNYLNLRGPLPDKSHPSTTKVQRLSLRLPVNKEGLKEANKIVELIAFQLKHNQFNWESWRRNDQIIPKGLKDSSINEAIENFKAAFFADPARRASFSGSKTTWFSAYNPYLTRLKKISPTDFKKLDQKLLSRTLRSYEENSRSRQQCAIAIGALAKHFEIDLPIDWKAQSSGYGLHKARFRKLPSDQLIKEAWLQIPNSKWKLVYGLMATYGLRNHEVFFSDFSGLSKNGDRIIRVLPNTKTGEHQVWPFHPEWFDIFDLGGLGIQDSLQLPKINTDLKQTTLQKVGRRVSEQFKRYKLPLTPYDLRHAWAIRTIHIGLPDTVAARMMGHSVAIHTKTYHHWITRRDQQKAVDAALSKGIA